MSLLIRERPPLRLTVEVDTARAGYHRWANDAPPEDVPQGASFSSTMPGGYEQYSATLQRSSELEYADTEEFATLTVRGLGGAVIAHQSRLESLPGTTGSQQRSVTPTAPGWQNHLQDDAAAREIFIDAQLSVWQGQTVARKLQLLGLSFDPSDAGTSADPTGNPSLVTQLTGPWSREQVCEGWYDAKGISIGKLLYAWKRGASVDPADTSWLWDAVLSTNDVAGAVDITSSLRAAGPGSGEIDATVANRKWALVQQIYTVAAGGDGVNYPLFWDYLAVVGGHGLTLHPAITAGMFGLLASDVIANALSRWAPKIAFTTGAAGSIQPSTFVIEQLAFVTPTTVADMINQATQYELLDWAVWDGPTFYLNPRGTVGRRWRARVGPANLQEAGPQVDRIWNQVIVAYTDVGGLARTAGPVGSGADTEDASLTSSDPENPANLAGLSRCSPLSMGTTTAAGAIQVGQRFLEEQALLSSAGQASLVGHVEDDHGVLWPAWMVRAGDTISFTDAADPSYRRIVRAAYDDSSKTASVSLDSPPDGLAQLLQRLSAVIAPYGFS